MKLGQRVAHERLLRVCHADYDRDMVLVADRRDPKTGEHELLGVGRLDKLPGLNEAEFAILVSDEWQNRGLGTEFLRMLVQIAKEDKLTRVSANIMTENLEMQHVCEKLSFKLQRDMKEAMVHAEVLL
jgi:acetyltransferase